MKTTDQYLAEFRGLVFGGIEKSLAQSSHCKGYEGRIEYGVALPSYFEAKHEREVPPEHQLCLHCYVLGPSRHYKWTAPSLDQVFENATADVRKWIAELAEED